ncbi:MAG: DUF72 domain-containing protein [Gemmatimonadetes bacterium]|nr:DUF72 domain-containing protein [Gemmatimonadota bacterium]
MRAFVGTSGYSYKEWKGNFYPEKIAANKMLNYYGQQFNGVEINNTFYRMPSERVLVNWYDEVPDSFVFVLKASRKITHFKRLKAEAEDELRYLLKTASVLRDKLGPTLFQLPPNLKKDLERLETFLAFLPKRWRAAFEFRHESWYDDDVYEALRGVNAALVVAETDEGSVPRVATADWGYLRLRKLEYTERELHDWADWMSAQEWSDGFAFFKHEDTGGGPELASSFRELLKLEPGAD